MFLVLIVNSYVSSQLPMSLFYSRRLCDNWDGNKDKTFNSSVKAILFLTEKILLQVQNCFNGTLTQSMLGRLQVFINKCFKRIVSTHLTDRTATRAGPVLQQLRRTKCNRHAYAAEASEKWAGQSPFLSLPSFPIPPLLCPPFFLSDTSPHLLFSSPPLRPTLRSRPLNATMVSGERSKLPVGSGAKPQPTNDLVHIWAKRAALCDSFVDFAKM